MNIRQLETFCAVMETGSISEAARVIRISQPAVTKSIRLLEEHLRIRLFIRQGRRLHPSVEAQRLYPSARKIFDDFEAAGMLAKRLQSGQAGKLNVAAAFTLATAFIPETIRSFHESHALVDIRFMALPPRQIIDLVMAQDIDLGILYEPVSSRTLRRVPLCRTEVVCVLPKGHHFERRADITAPDLAGHTIISFSEQSYAGGLIKRHCEAAGTPWTVGIEVNQTPAALSLVEAGVGIAIVDPLALVGHPSNRIVVKPFRPRTTLLSHAVYAAGRPLPVTCQNFVATLTRVITDHAKRMPAFLQLA